MSIMRVAVKIEDGKIVDRWPIMFRPECERTYFDARTGKDEGLDEVIERLAKRGMELWNISDKRLERKGKI